MPSPRSIALVAGATLLAFTACQPKPRVEVRPPPVIEASPAPPPAPPAVEPAPDADDAIDASLLRPPAGALPALGSPPVDLRARRRWLEEQLDALFGKTGQDPPSLAGAMVSVQVAELDGGRALYQRQPRQSLNAASNVKLVTMAAALSALGPEYSFRTSVLGPPRTPGLYLKPGGELDGDIYLRAGGDPTLTEAHLARLADQLRSLGIRRIGGSIVVDRSFFDAQSMPPAFDQKQESGAFRAPSSAASLNANAVAVTMVPAARAGGLARVSVSPASPYLELRGRVVTADSGPAWPQVETRDGGERTIVQVSGRIAVDSEPVTLLRRIVHPELFLGHSFLQALASRGIQVGKGLRTGEAPAGLRTLAVHASEPLGVILRELGKQSNNFTAEQIVRALGAEMLGPPGTWHKGLEATARYLDKLGIPRASYRLENGSGLYDSNRFSAEQMVRVLRAALTDFRIAGEFLAALSLAGGDGTLAHRMAGSPAERYLRGKTGTLQGTSCLSGVVGAPGKPPLLFSVLMNQVADTARARAVQDQMGAVLALYLEPTRAPAPPPAEPAPPAPPPGPTPVATP